MTRPAPASAAVRPRVLALLCAALAACGPIGYVGEVTRRAGSAVEAARRADAERRAPYWWTRATLYLREARASAARADFQGANRFGRLAAEAAEQAIEDAKDPTKRPIDPTPVPAKEPAAPAAGRPEGAPAKGRVKGRAKVAPAKGAQ